LHGNGLKKETCPDGSKDENVFDIRQGTAIAIFIKQKDKQGCSVYHSNQYGLREAKYIWLKTKRFLPKNYYKIEPDSPWYFFIPRDTKKIRNYLKWKKIKEIFPINVTGIVTARDGFVIDIDSNRLRNKIIQFKNTSIPDDTIREVYKLKDTRGWKLVEARSYLANDDNWDTYFKNILIHPFDIREIYYSTKMVDWGRPELMRHMLENKNNLGLILSKRVEGNKKWEHVFITDKIITHHSLSMKEVNYVSPLFLYPEHDSGDWIEQQQTERQPNIAPEIIEQLSSNFGVQPTPEEILFYIYAVFYSNVYRERYAEFLKIDFPRVPFTSNYELFKKMGNLGEKIANLHLLKSSELDKPISRYLGSGEENKIDKPKYNEEEKRVYINNYKFFDNVEPEVWKYQIGGYQILHKYLKDRKGRQMEDPRHYCRVITALALTIKYQKEIDEIYDDVEKEIVEF
jgi:predicted helicase